MLDYHSAGIQKYILDWLTQIHEEVVKEDPEYRQPGKSRTSSLRRLAPNSFCKACPALYHKLTFKRVFHKQ